MDEVDCSIGFEVLRVKNVNAAPEVKHFHLRSFLQTDNNPVNKHMYRSSRLNDLKHEQKLSFHLS